MLDDLVFIIIKEFVACTCKFHVFDFDWVTTCGVADDLLCVLFAVFCYGQSYSGGPGCDAKHGNPFGPFWDTFNIDFDSSEYYEPLSFDTSNPFEVKRWQER